MASGIVWPCEQLGWQDATCLCSAAWQGRGLGCLEHQPSCGPRATSHHAGLEQVDRVCGLSGVASGDMQRCKESCHCMLFNPSQEAAAVHVCWPTAFRRSMSLFPEPQECPSMKPNHNQQLITGFRAGISNCGSGLTAATASFWTLAPL